MPMLVRRHHVMRSGATCLAVVAAALATATGVTAAATPADPQGGAQPVPPHFYSGNVEGIRSAGSDTTLFLMQKIGDLYTGAGLYGCALNSAAGQTLFNTNDPAAATNNENFYCQANANTSTTDTGDNWDRTEVTEGVDDIGSSAGQSQLCNALSTPLPVDFARSAKPVGSACSGLAQLGFAKDAIPIIEYPINASTYGTSTTAPYSGINGGVVGPVASGWLPGDSPAGPFSGTALSNISNNDNGGGAGSTAYRIWCATGATRISDWGQLTNLGPSLLTTGVSLTSGSPTISVASAFPSTVSAGDAVSGSGVPAGTTLNSVSGTSAVLSNNATLTQTSSLVITTTGKLTEGQGAPIGIPIRVMGINTAAGIESTFSSFAESGVSGGGCSSSMNTNAASDPNPATATGTNSTPHIALQNNSDQVDEFAIGDFPSPDFVDQAIEATTTLLVESNGVVNTNPYAGAVTINGSSFGGTKVEENGTSPTTASLLQNTYPTAITLFNVYLSSTVRGSTAGFLNWMCDGDTNFEKGLDNSTGQNFDGELATLISTTFGFPRLTDESAAPAISTPADAVPAPNNSCAASLTVTAASGTNTITLTAGGNFPVDIASAGGLIGGGNVGVVSTDFPSGTTVVSGEGTSTLTLSKSATGSGSAAASFTGVPGITSVANPQS
jgi:hypothetical protein